MQAEDDAGLSDLHDLTNQIGDDGAKEKPPEFDGAIQLLKTEGLDAIIEIAEKLRSAANRGKRFRSGAAELRIL